MTEHKFTDEQIIEALEIRMPHDAICREAYGLIKRLTEENGRLVGVIREYERAFEESHEEHRKQMELIAKINNFLKGQCK